MGGSKSKQKERNHQPGWIARGTRSNQVLNPPQTQGAYEIRREEEPPERTLNLEGPSLTVTARLPSDRGRHSLKKGEIRIKGTHRFLAISKTSTNQQSS